MKTFKEIVCSGLLLLLATSAPLADGTLPEKLRKSCRDVVQGFYDWYIPKALNEGATPASDLAIKYRGSLFAPYLLQALREDSQAQGKAVGEIVGLDFDPFLNSQDPRPRYVLGNVTYKDDKCWVEILSASSDKGRAEPAVVTELILERAHWMFVNFHYGKSKRSGDENLVSILKKLRAKRQKDSK